MQKFENEETWTCVYLCTSVQFWVSVDGFRAILKWNCTVLCIASAVERDC